MNLVPSHNTKRRAKVPLTHTRRRHSPLHPRRIHAYSHHWSSRRAHSWGSRTASRVAWRRRSTHPRGRRTTHPRRRRASHPRRRPTNACEKSSVGRDDLLELTRLAAYLSRPEPRTEASSVARHLSLDTIFMPFQGIADLTRSRYSNRTKIVHSLTLY